MDLSHKSDLIHVSEIIADIQFIAPNQPFMLIGAAARDIQLTHAHNISIARKTQDVDLALATPDWSTFNSLREKLLSSGKFIESKSIHKITHTGAGRCEVDIVPFGDVENDFGRIQWPPEKVIDMGVIGMREAYATATNVILPKAIEVKVASIPGIMLLKIAAWKDRRNLPPLGKDASDIRILLREYINAGNQSRAYEDARQFFNGDNHQFEQASAWLLGCDVAKLLDQTNASAMTRHYFFRAVGEQATAGVESMLIEDMRSVTPEEDLSSLEQFWAGLQSKLIP